jgi:hypothetical protein
MSASEARSKPSTSRIAVGGEKKTRKQISNSLALIEPEAAAAAAFVDAFEDILRAERQGY